MKITKESISRSLIDRAKESIPTLDEADAYFFTARFIDDQPTANKRIYSREWREAMTSQFIGQPITLNHSVMIEESIGYVIDARLADDGSIDGAGVLLRSREKAADVITRLDAGESIPVSIESSLNPVETRADGMTVVKPGPYSRVQALSFVGIGACARCHASALQEAAGCRCGSPEAPGASAGTEAPDPLREFAESQLKAVKQETVRLAGLLLGTGNDARQLYTRIADQLSTDPVTLTSFREQLSRAYAENNSAVPITGGKDDAETIHTIDAALRTIETINQFK